MLKRHIYLSATILLAASGPLAAAQLRPHQAVYDLSLVSQTDELIAVEGRIALKLQASACDAYDLDYRFAARFRQSGETTLTDQHTRAKERGDGKSFEFEMRTFVDGLDQGSVRGTADNLPEKTRVTMREPVERQFDLPPSRFPLAHTGDLISRAKAGERIVETRLFDGDVEAEKLLTTTSIIVPVSAGVAPSARVAERVGGLRSWKVDESYFNSDSDEDGQPVFHTRYRLYENGVSDEIFMDFGDYALAGSISTLDYLKTPDCPGG